MKLYRFSPIKNEDQLLEAIKYIHFACYELCRKSIGQYLPTAGNVGIFCHYEDEYTLLTKLREQLTEASYNFNQKYYRLIKPIVIPKKDGIPETTYDYLYIRQTDPYRSQVGDVDFVLDHSKYIELKNKIVAGSDIKGARAFSRPDLDMVELYNPDVDVLGYITTETMAERVRVK